MKIFYYYILPPLIVITLWITSLIMLPVFIGTPETRGQFGDSFGAINALFSGLALAGIIITLVMQRQELALQREELKLTREELKKSSNALSAQVELMTLSALIQGYQNEMINADDMRTKSAPPDGMPLMVPDANYELNQHKRDLRVQINSLFEQLRSKSQS